MLEGLGELYLPASKAAEIALRGVSTGTFIIPTHAFQREDIDARHAEAVAGFALLE